MGSKRAGSQSFQIPLYLEGWAVFERNGSTRTVRGHVIWRRYPRYDLILTVSCRVPDICPDPRALSVVMHHLVAAGQPFSCVAILSLS